MFKITKCEDCVVYLQFTLIATSRLKSGKVLKVIIICLVKGRTRSAFSMLVEMAICLLIVYRMTTFWQTKMQDILTKSNPILH